MPIYEYECQKCQARQEVYQRVTDKPPKKCSKCGGKLERMISAPAIQFKGSGWYVTDYAGDSRKASEKSEKAESEATVTKDQKSEKTDKKTKESSPVKKTSEKASSPKVSTGD
jgi:putative FmdB family regulatory protein